MNVMATKNTTKKHKISTKKPMFGNMRSFSERATRRRFNLNMQTKRIYVEEIDQFITVRVTAGELRTIDKIGLKAFLERQGLTLKKLLEA